MPNAMIPIANTTLGSNTASVTFSSIVGTYRDLLLVVQGTTTSGQNVTLQFNSDTGSNYIIAHMYGGSGQGTSTVTSTFMYANYFANWDSVQANIVANILDYTATDKHKTALIRDNSTSTYTEAIAGRWANTAAITSIKVAASTLFSTGTSFALYGVVA
jgi:alpha-D-ribose 1-methylphosphonate 5-triphosphate synthase subunit PhnL